MRTVVLGVVLALVAACAPAAKPDVLLATTTSFRDTGLLDVLAKDFEAKTGYHLKYTAVGTGAALAIGARGDADVLVVHAPSQEQEFMRAGNGRERVLVMHNDFVLVGPSADPARAKGASATDAFRRIAETRSRFISRGDNSGTNIKEIELWAAVKIAPSGDWYVQANTGMGQTLKIASEKSAYTLTDRGTYLAQKVNLTLDLLVEKHGPLLNPYHVITVDPAKFPRANANGARAFVDYLVSPQTQRFIASFGVAQYGEPLFIPDAGKDDSIFQ